MKLLHLALDRDWRRALASGSYDMSTRGATIRDVGYLHACADRAQLEGVAGRFYADVTQPLVVIEIDEPALVRLGLEVRREPADPAADPAGQELFPHVYGGPVPVAAVTRVAPYALAEAAER